MKLNLSREYKIGIFGVMMLACLYFGINFLKGQDLFTSTKTYYAVYDQVNGLQPSSVIVIKGFKVGTVTNMSYDPNKSDKVILEFAIKSKFRIPENSTARIYSEGIMSGKSVEIELGDSQVTLHEGDTLHSVNEKGLMEVAGSELEFLKQRANTVINEVMITLTNLNMILADNADNINRTLTNTANITGDISSVISNEKGSLEETLRNLNALSTTLKNKSDEIDRIVDNAATFSDSLSKAQFPAMIAEMTSTLNKLNTTIDKVNNGEGTVGRFLTDEALYDSLVVTSGNLSALLDDIKRNPRRYINVSVFGGGKKDK